MSQVGCNTSAATTKFGTSPQIHLFREFLLPFSKRKHTYYILPSGVQKFKSARISGWFGD